MSCAATDTPESMQAVAASNNKVFFIGELLNEYEQRMGAQL